MSIATYLHSVAAADVADPVRRTNMNDHVFPRTKESGSCG